MARTPKIWFRKDRKIWMVTIDGIRHNLGASKKDAQESFHKLMASKPTPNVIAEITIAKLLDNFLIWVKENRAEKTFDSYTRKLQAFLDSLSNGAMPASAIRPYHVENWASGNGWSASYKRTCMGVVKRACNWAIRHGLIDKNPIANLERPAEERRDNCPTMEEFKAMRDLVTDCFGDVLDFCFETGCRPREVVAIEGRHYKDDKIQFPVKESKGKRRTRVIYLNHKAKAIIKRRMNKGHLFTNRNGNPWTKDAVNCRMCRIAEKTGKKFALRDLRHFYATRMLEGGMDHVTLAKLMGHVDASMIARVYGHIGERSNYLQEQVNKAG